MAKGFKTGGRVSVYREIDFVCAYCGKVFHSDKADKNRAPKYCSRECSGLANTKWLVCTNCGQKYKSDTNGHKNKYFCSMKCAAEYKTGKPLTDEHRAALSRAKIGKPILHLHTPEVIAKISKALAGKPQYWMRGENHPNYKDGGVGYSERNKDMGRAEYKEWRRLVFVRDDFTCQICQDKGKRLHAHHIEQWSKNAELRYEVNNGLTLCVECHRNIHKSKEHQKADAERNRFRFESIGI